MRQMAPETLKKQIDELAPKWDRSLTHTEIDGKVWLAYKRPVAIPMGGGVGFVDDLIEPICTLGPDYPLSAAMRHRRRFFETNAYAQAILAREKRRKALAEEAQLEAVDHEIRSDVRRLAKDSVTVTVPRAESR